MIDWLPPSLVATFCVTLIMAFLCGYLYLSERERFLGIWSFSWGIYSLRFLIHLLMELGMLPSWCLFLQQVASLVSALAFIHGAHVFVERPLPRFWVILLSVSIFWALISQIFAFPFILSDLPVSFAMGGAYIASGDAFLRCRKLSGTGKKLVGGGLILWGIHKADYPFVRPLAWAAPWGYLLASVLFLFTSIGILLLYYEQIRQKLKAEIGERVRIEAALRKNILDRDEAVLALKKSQERYALAQRAADIASWDWDLVTGKISCCWQIEAILGALPERSESTYDALMSCVHPEDRRYVIDAANVAISGRKEFHIEHRIELPNGTVRWISQKGDVFRDSAGNPIRMIAVLQDITGRRKARDEKLKLETQLRQSQKMEAIGTLAGGIAHDFNNILSIIIGYSDLILEMLPEGSLIKSNVKEIMSAGGRAKALVRQILTYSRQNEQCVEPVHMNHVLNEVLSFLRASIPANIEIKSSLASDCGNIMADATQMHQLVMNLCTNAYHSMREKGGVLNVNLSAVDLPIEELLPGFDLTPGRYLKIEVSDTGIGMDKATLSRIFDPYFTTKEREEGTGLGLATVHGIVVNQGGHISVFSEPGVGTTFVVYLPQSVIATAPFESCVIQDAPQGSERILIVDDEAPLAAMMEMSLARLGYRVTSLTNSGDALELFRTHPDDFDLVVTDLAMPKMTGVELARELLSVRPGLPIILCTGFGHDTDDIKAKAIGIHEFIIKPVDRIQLSVAIRNSLDAKGQYAAAGRPVCDMIPFA